MKRLWQGVVTETRSRRYIVEAEGREDAMDKVREGKTWAQAPAAGDRAILKVRCVEIVKQDRG